MTEIPANPIKPLELEIKLENNPALNYKIELFNDLPSKDFAEKIYNIYKKPTQFFIITDSNLHKEYKDYIRETQENLINHNCECVIINLQESGEVIKSFKTFEDISEQLISHNITRNSCLIAFGGGTIGDLTGFLASTIVRGVDFIQCPTTLLAMVDSSIGGKTAINSKTSKNSIGAFKQPRIVISNIKFLKTLPEREYSSGLAEITKHVLIFEGAGSSLNDSAKAQPSLKNLKELDKMIYNSCQLKARIVSLDEQETKGIRATLNFGHTIGHALEKINFSSYLQKTEKPTNITHGEAVAIGMIIELYIAHQMKELQDENFNEAIKYIESNNLVTHLSSDILELIQKPTQSFCLEIIKLMSADKKNSDPKSVKISELFPDIEFTSSEGGYRLKEEINIIFLRDLSLEERHMKKNDKVNAYTKSVKTKELFSILTHPSLNLNLIKKCQ